MNNGKSARQNRVFGLTFLFLTIGLVEFWMMDLMVMVVTLGILALLNMSRLIFRKRLQHIVVDISILLSNAIMTGAAAYIYHQMGNDYSKWLWGILSFFYLVLCVLLLMGSNSVKKS